MFSNLLQGASPPRFWHFRPSDLDDGANYIVQTHLPDSRSRKDAKESTISGSDTQQQINPWQALTSHSAKWGLWQRQLTKSFLLSAVKGRELGLPALSTHQSASRFRLFVGSSFPFLFRASILTITFGSLCSSPRLLRRDVNSTSLPGQKQASWFVQVASHRPSAPSGSGFSLNTVNCNDDEFQKLLRQSRIQWRREQKT